MDKYKELLHDYNTNYGIFIIMSNEPLQDVQAANNEDTKAIDIYDEDINSKKYITEITHFRSMIDKYDNINKQIKIILKLYHKLIELNISN